MTPFIHVIFTGVSCRHACTVAHQQSKNKMHTRKAIEHDEIGWETLWRLIMIMVDCSPSPSSGLLDRDSLGDLARKTTKASEKSLRGKETYIDDYIVSCPIRDSDFPYLCYQNLHDWKALLTPVQLVVTTPGSPLAHLSPELLTIRVYNWADFWVVHEETNRWANL